MYENIACCIATKPPHSQMPQATDNSPLVIVDPLDLEGKTSEERLQLALSAISRNGLKANGRPIYPIREAARAFGVSKTTLTARFNGRKTRIKAHEDERKLSVGCEHALVEWVAEMGRRYMPLHASAVAAHASLISGEPVGESWVHRFRSRHPELKVRWATGLEKCRAQALNRAAVDGFRDTLEELLERYNIQPWNLYNMDEKGIQLGMGQRVRAFVDRDQKCVFQVEDGDRELVTIIECISADGHAIRPSVVFKGARRNMEWGRDNPCQARSVISLETPLDADLNSISHSPKGWTDQELGSAWLERDFEPATAKRNQTQGYRLLILDGHNSHTTYQFCSFAEKHKIIVLCLPSHTTHRLQPCDVGVFGPLSSSWKSLVNEMSADYIPIRKGNLLSYYSRAREKAFTERTIKSAFRKTGIWPFDRNTIEEDAFAPALNTTTHAAVPVPPTLPSLLVCTSQSPSPLLGTSSMVDETSTNGRILRSSSRQASSSRSDATETSAGSTAAPSSTGPVDMVPIGTNEPLVPTGQSLVIPEFEIAGLPPEPTRSTSREDLMAANLQLRELLEQARFQMQRDYALKKLMEKENERLRQRLFNKTNKPKNKQSTGHARHMTSEEVLEELAREDWQAAMKEVFKSDVFKQRKRAYDQYCRDELANEKAAEKARKAVEKANERARKAAEKLQVQQEQREARERAREAGKQANTPAAARPTRPRRGVAVRAATELEVVDEEGEDVVDEAVAVRGPPDAGGVTQKPRAAPKRRAQAPARSVADQLQEMGPVRTSRRLGARR
jgi:hypothetical protein